MHDRGADTDKSRYAIGNRIGINFGVCRSARIIVGVSNLNYLSDDLQTDLISLSDDSFKSVERVVRGMTDLVFYANGRAMKCDGCDAPVGDKDARFWDKSTKRRYCEKCGQDKGGIVGGSTNASKDDKAITIKPLVVCQNCGDMVDHVTHIINIGGADIDMNICDRCEWLRRASWQLKLNGMWKPTPKHEPLREVKA